MRVAVITPYHGEPREWLGQCHESVRAQSHPCVHILVADGMADNSVDQFVAQHIILGHGHNDYGDTPRAVGSMAAIAQGFDAIAYLDADNWYKPTHIESLVALHQETDAPLLTSGRVFYRMDGSFMGLCPYSDGESHVDVGCYLMTRPCFRLALEWAMIPRDLHAIDDRLILHRAKEWRIPRAHSWRASMCYRATAAIDYKLLGETPPADAAKGRAGVKNAVDALVARGGPNLSGGSWPQEKKDTIRQRTAQVAD